MGNFDTSIVEEAQFAAAIKTVDYLSDTYGIPEARTYVKGHREYSSTACPGGLLYSLLDELVRRANIL